MVMDGPTDQRIGTPSFISLVPCLLVGKYTGNVKVKCIWKISKHYSSSPSFTLFRVPGRGGEKNKNSDKCLEATDTVAVVEIHRC